VLSPSNPIVSIGPIVSLPGVRDALRDHPRVLAVSPLVNGVPLKGPADKLMSAVGQEVSAAGVAAMYADFCDTFVLDATDGTPVERIDALGIETRKLPTIMTGHAESEALARAMLE
jgi:LPPG:FO 2-phospho-L-lactate transferase